MTQIFVEASQINTADNSVIITGDDHNHIKNVLRMKPGEEISVRCEGVKKEYRCGIISLTDSEVICEIRFVKEDDTELPVRITVYQALPKGDKMETVIQKCTELGAVRIVPVRTSRCIVKLDDKKAASKCERWQLIAKGASEQSQRGIIPQIGPVMDLDEMLRDAENTDIKLMPYELSEGMDRTREIIRSIKPDSCVAIFIGPEGGFDRSEVEQASDSGFVPITLGKRILRTETAAMTVLGWFVYEFDGRG